MTLDASMTGCHVHHRRVEIIVTTYAFHFGHGQCHAKKGAAIVATTTVRTISTTIAAIKDRKSDNHCVKAAAVTSAKPHVINRLRGESASLDTA